MAIRLTTVPSAVVRSTIRGMSPAPQEPARAFRAHEVPVLDDVLPPQENRADFPRDVPAFVRAVVHGAVQVLGVRRPCDAWIEDDDVSVAAHGDGALLRVQPEQPRRTLRHHVDHRVGGDPPLPYAIGIHEAELRLESRQAVRDLGKILRPEALLAVVTERA